MFDVTKVQTRRSAKNRIWVEIYILNFHPNKQFYISIDKYQYSKLQLLNFPLFIPLSLEFINLLSFFAFSHSSLSI